MCKIIRCRESALLVGVLAFCCVGHAQKSSQDQFDFANGLFHRGFFTEAIDEYERYLDQSPDSADASTAWLRLGRAAMAIEAYDKALNAFAHAASTAQTPVPRFEALVSRAEALFAAGRHDEVIAVLTEVNGADMPPEFRARALFYLGRAHYALGALEKAQEALNALASEVPDDELTPFAHYYLGFVCVEMDLREAAANAFSEAANAPDAVPELRMESRFRAAELYDMLGWTAAALGAYEQLRSDFPDSDYARRAEYGYAWALYHSGKFTDATAAADAFLRKQPESPHASGLEYLRGNCLHQMKRYSEALVVYNKIREKYPVSSFAISALYKSAWAHYLMGDAVTARDVARAFLDQYPENDLAGEAGYLLGLTHVASGDYEEALKEFRFAVASFPDSEFNADALFKSAECYARLGLRDEAARVFEEFAGKYPDNPLAEQAMLRSGDARFTEQDFAEALVHYEHILEAPGDEKIEEETLYRMAVVHHNMKQYAESASIFRRLLNKFPESGHAAEAWRRIGTFELQHNNDALKAIEAYQAALKSSPDETIAARALQGLASARYVLKDYGQAAAHLLQLVQEHPNIPSSPDVMLWCGQWLYDAERWTEAADMLTALLEAYPEHEERAGVAFIIARCFEAAGDMDKAVAAYEAALEQETEATRLAEICFRLGDIHRNREGVERTIALYEQAANLDGGEMSARARFQLAALYEEKGEYENAARNYMRLAILFVHENLSPEALWRAANCYQALQNSGQAKSILDELIRDYPDSSFARQARELLETIRDSDEKTE